LTGQLAHEAAAAARDGATAIWEQVRAELAALIHSVVDAPSYAQAEAAVVTLRHLRLSHGRNHGPDPRLERAKLVWATIGTANRPQLRTRLMEV
jgi:hypothetical protein